MTIERRYSVEENLGILSVAGHLGGAMGWVLTRGAGPVVADLRELRSCSTEGQAAIIEAARHIAASGRSLEPAVIPAFAAHRAERCEPVDEWHATEWPAPESAPLRFGSRTGDSV
ncbi:anti-sigma factor antagonist [Streptomyces collinus]|uniref:anti-sigma factor antagonist n=1 Tax=Streptomyces collinus TaxID=42684 RepID=UPI0033E9E22C